MNFLSVSLGGMTDLRLRFGLRTPLAFKYCLR
jgi:hypothetical protein